MKSVSHFEFIFQLWAFIFELWAIRFNAKTMDIRDRGIKKVTALDHGGGFCCKGKSYAIIVEPFFATNQDDFMHDGKNRMLLLEAYSNALKRI